MMCDWTTAILGERPAKGQLLVVFLFDSLLERSNMGTSKELYNDLKTRIINQY